MVFYIMRTIKWSIRHFSTLFDTRKYFDAVRKGSSTGYVAVLHAELDEHGHRVLQERAVDLPPRALRCGYSLSELLAAVEQPERRAVGRSLPTVVDTSPGLARFQRCGN